MLRTTLVLFTAVALSIVFASAAPAETFSLVSGGGQLHIGNGLMLPIQAAATAATTGDDFPILLVASLLALAALLLWSDGDSAHRAAAYPGLTVGIDMNPTTTTDTNGDGVYELPIDLSTFEHCRDILPGQPFAPGQQIDIDVFVLDATTLAAGR